MHYNPTTPGVILKIINHRFTVGGGPETGSSGISTCCDINTGKLNYISRLIFSWRIWATWENGSWKKAREGWNSWAGISLG